MENGILIIATQHKLYGRMAYNLALTIRARDKEVKIALVHDSAAIAHLTPKHLKVFDIMIPTELAWRDVKFSLPTITPFERTLHLDADMVWIRPGAVDVFSLLDERMFTCVNEGYYDVEQNANLSNRDYGWGANVQEIMKKYRITKGKLWKIRAEFMLFRRTKTVERMFTIAGQICASPKVKTTTFAGGSPTEFAFDIAMHKTGIEPHKSKWQPTFWPTVHRNSVPEIWQISKKYYALSAGGGRYLKRQKQIYDLAVKAASISTGLVSGFPLQAKNEHLTERKSF